MTTRLTSTAIGAALSSAYLALCVTVGAAMLLLPDALAQKASSKIGFTVPNLGVDQLIATVLAPADDVRIAADLQGVANAVWAGVLVCILMFIVIGCVRLASGARGAGEKLALVFGSTILLIAAVGVFQ